MLLTEQEIRDIARSVKDIGENSDRALILAAQKAVIAKIKAQGPVAYLAQHSSGEIAIGSEDSPESTYWSSSFPVYNLPSEGD